jgi:hypothetical protein
VFCCTLGLCGGLAGGWRCNTRQQIYPELLEGGRTDDKVGRCLPDVRFCCSHWIKNLSSNSWHLINANGHMCIHVDSL